MYTEEMIKNLADHLATLWSCYYSFRDKYENRRECPFFSEAKGMEFALNNLHIGYEYEFDSEYDVCALKVNDYRVEITKF